MGEGGTREQLSGPRGLVVGWGRKEDLQGNSPGCTGTCGCAAVGRPPVVRGLRNLVEELWRPVAWGGGGV